MRDRIEALGDILLAAAHADHHVEAQEIDKIEEILTTIWRADASAEAVVKRVADLKPGEADAAELEQLAARMKALEPKNSLPSELMQRLADFDPGRFDIDEAVGPFLHEPVEVKRRLLELAVSVHEADGELDFAEDTFIRELGFKLGLDLSQFGDLLLEFLPGATPGKKPTESSEPDDAVPADGATSAEVPDAASTDLVVPTGNGASPTGAKRKAPPSALRALAKKAAKVVKKAARKATAKKKAPAAKKKAPAKKKAAKKTATKKTATKKTATKKTAAKKKAPAKKKAAKKTAKKKKR